MVNHKINWFGFFMSDTTKPDDLTTDGTALSELLIPETSPSDRRDDQRHGTGDGPRGGEEEMGRGQSLVNVHQGSREEPDPTADVVVSASGAVPAAPTAEGDPASIGFPIFVPALPEAVPGVSVAIRITQVPDTVILSAGTAKGGGVVELTPDELPGLFALPADGSSPIEPQPFGVEIVLTNTETGEQEIISSTIGVVQDSDAAANQVMEGAANGTAVGLTAVALDPDAADTVTYSLIDDAGGRFAIDPNTGVITIADTSLLDSSVNPSHAVTIQATSSDGSTSAETFTINVTNGAPVGPVTDSDGTANTISESVANGSAVGLTGLATDADATDTVTYSLTDNAGGRFAIDTNTGVVTVADTSLLDFETATSHTVTVQATSTDGSTSTETFTINLTDDTSEAAVGPVTDSDGTANTIGESVADGTSVGLTGLATDADATDTVTYSLTDNAGGRFAIDTTRAGVSPSTPTRVW
jgi:VCBS repeat-containing protein